jgi:hypothetical protein
MLQGIRCDGKTSCQGSGCSPQRSSRSRRRVKATSSGVSSTATKSTRTPNSGRDRPNGSSTTMIGVGIVTCFVSGWRIELPWRSSNKSAVMFGTCQAAGSAPSAKRVRQRARGELRGKAPCHPRVRPCGEAPSPRPSPRPLPRPLPRPSPRKRGEGAERPPTRLMLAPMRVAPQSRPYNGNVARPPHVMTLVSGPIP